MSPPVATFESASSAVVNAPIVKKDLAVRAASNAQSKTLAELEDNWESFTFAPIRESQVSRAMSASPFGY